MWPGSQEQLEKILENRGRGSTACLTVSASLQIPGRKNTKLGAVQVNVVDYKLFTNADGIGEGELRTIRDTARRLIDNLRTYTTFMTPGQDKVATNIDLVSSDIGKLVLHLKLGKMDDPFIKRFEVALPKKHADASGGELHDVLCKFSAIQPGGNVPNMIRNIVHAMQSDVLSLDMRLALFSTNEPVFMEWFAGIPAHVRERIVLTHLSVPSRKALHFPYTSDKPGGIGTLGLVTPMHSTIQGVGAHFDSLVDANHVLVSESLAELVRPDMHHSSYREFQNPSTAFREQCPLESYNLMLKHGRVPFISMNNEEMEQYLKSIETRRALGGTTPSSNQNPDDVVAPSFNHPFDDDRELNGATASLVTESFNRYFACITPHPEEIVYFPVSVSCGPFGGYLVACTPDGKRYALYSSTPHGEGTAAMLRLVGDNDDISIHTKRTMGAGDSVASVLSMAHLWDVERMMGTLRQKQHPIDRKFIEIAAAVFVSLLSRFMGEILYHSDRCDWMSVPPARFPQIIHATAGKSLDLAADLWNKVDGRPRAVREGEWDIDVAVWQL